MKLTTSPGAKVFLTGVTGFVGKVVLEELLRRFDDQELETIYVLIRADRKGHGPEERFRNEVQSSLCFSKLPAGWSRRIRVIGGELSKPGCGISDSDRHHLVDEVTHLINCAASVEFDLPVAEAAAANITASLNVLEFARWCTRLQSMVNVSTAYVTPHRRNDLPVEEALVPLKRPAQTIYHTIVDGTANEKALLKEVGLPNTYTLTKCLSEHLLEARKGDVPLTIVRPSIVSASWRYPFPGWIDSKAAFAGFVALIGSGYLRAVVVQYPTLLDIVPCDVVASRIIDSAFAPRRGDSKKTIIHHAVAGVANSCSVETCIDIIEDYYRRHPVDRYAHLKYAGPMGIHFRLRSLQYHQIPTGLLATWHGLRGKAKQQRQVRRLSKQLNYLNKGFPYFTHNTFDFRSSMPLNEPDFQKEKYIETVCRGVYRFLMKKDETQVTLAGRHHKKGKGDLRWVRQQPKGNWAIRLSAYAARKALRKCAEKITFDRPAFEAARAAVPEGSLMVIVPTHRSYMDFVLCSYLFFTHPELGIAIPHIAAAEEFSKIPFLGWLFQQTQAFYVQRGLGRENPALTKKVHELVGHKQTLEFFIEGMRSRSRKLLKPRRGILKCLQASGQTCSILPVTISYDRVPEEASLLRELRGEPKSEMRLAPLFQWLGRLARGEIDLGRIHISCGKVIALNTSTDLHSLSREITAQLQCGLATTTHHLRCFLKQNPHLDLSLEWLCEAVIQRGGTLLDSPLGGEAGVDAATERSMRYQWMHLFYSDACSLYPNHPVIQHHIVQNFFGPLRKLDPETIEKDPKLHQLLHALFEPVCRDYATVATILSAASTPLPSPREILNQVKDAHLPSLEEAFDDLVERQILTRDSASGAFKWGPQAKDIEDYKVKCILPKNPPRLAAVG